VQQLTSIHQERNVFEIWKTIALNRLTSTAAGGWFVMVLLIIALCGAVALAFALLDLVDIWVLKAGLLLLACLSWLLHEHHPMRHEAFKWRSVGLLNALALALKSLKDRQETTLSQRHTRTGFRALCFRFSAKI
jgi:hypothetical protein